MDEIINQLEEIERMLNNVKDQVQELRERIRGAPNPTQKLSVPEFYEHPWYKYKREQLISSGNYQQSKGEETPAA
jgi:hypothetical protein